MPDQDRRLVEVFLEHRSAAAFHALYERHTPILFGLAVRLVGRPEAEDVVQDVWLRAVAALPGFRWGSALRTWLCGIVINCCRERWRATPDLESDGDAFVVTRPDITLDLESALAQLPRGYRAVVVLHDIYGHTHAEISELLGCEAGTSKSQLARGRRALREILGAATGGEPA